MLQKTVQLHYHLQEQTIHRDIYFLQSLVHDIAALGYYVVALSEYESIYRHGQGYYLQQLARSDNEFQGISVLAESELLKYAEDEHQALRLVAFPTLQDELARSYTCGLHFPARSLTASLIISLSSIGFSTSLAASETIFERWLDIFSALWRNCQPLYAHSSSPFHAWPEPGDEDLQNASLDYLYEINYFSEQFVTQLGKERLQQTPAWRVSPVGQTSFLLVPEFIFAPRLPGQGEKVAQDLGMKRFVAGQYLPQLQP